MKPLISVIIPAYNDEKTIEAAVNSILSQTYENLEVIIVDDGSSDKTLEIANKIANRDSRVRTLVCPLKDPHRIDWRGVNISVGYLARNYAMDQSKGEWITFQDADDTSFKNRIEIQLTLARRFGATLITTSWLKLEEGLEKRSFDVDMFESDNKMTILTPEDTTRFAVNARGILMADWFPYRYIPFELKKWFPGMRKFFFGTGEPYPGADNSMFFKREIIKSVRFRRLRDRQWPALSGRGVGRDFVCNVAYRFKNSYSFNIPLYLWRNSHDNKSVGNCSKYLRN